MAKIIMHLLQSDKYSGAESVVCQIIEAFRDMPEYKMVYVSPRGSIEGILKQRGIEYLGLDAFSQKEIDRAVRVVNPDIIHAHDFNASVRVVKYRRLIISHIHNNPLWLSKLDPRSLIYLLCLKHYKRVIGVSNSILEEYIFSRKLAEKFLLLPNVVDSEKVKAGSIQACSEISDILFVGRLSQPKNPKGFLEIVKMVHDANANVRVLMIGEGPLLDECKKIIDNNGLDNVKLLGFDENPYKYMRNTKVLVMPSIYEGFGLVAVEAMILGIPVVCTPVGGLLNIVDDDCGFISSDMKEMSDEILKMLSNEEIRQIKGKKAQKKAIGFCNMTEYKRKLQMIYDDIKE